MEKSIQVYVNSDLHKHVETIVERFGDNARLKHDGGHYKIVGFEPVVGRSFTLILESVL